MKSLDQIASTGIALNDTNTPGDSSNQFIISNPGSYYLTGNIAGESGKNGISIQASNVTIDLNGFALIGGSGTIDGIVAPAPQTNIRVHNGSAQSWGGSGFNLQSATNSQYRSSARGAERRFRVTDWRCLHCERGERRI